MVLFSILPTFIYGIFNTEFNYAEHLNKQYLTANYSAPWKPLANKLAMLMWESVLIFLAACAYKGSKDPHVKQIGLDLEIKQKEKRNSGVSRPLLPQTRAVFRLLISTFNYCQKRRDDKKRCFWLTDSHISAQVRAPLEWVDISASR